jgi:DNA processing protein
MDQERAYWVALNMVPQVGSVSFRRVIDHFGSPQKVFTASAQELQSVPGLRKEAARAIGQFPYRQELEKEWNFIRSHDVKIITWQDKEYPENLKNIHDPPPVLYLKGQLDPRDKLAVAIVGTRHASSYGLKMAEELARQMAQRGITIVSGMARGIDSAAHRGALAAGGRTIAVWGSGLEVVYPSENKDLAEEIAQKGAILSQFPMKTQPNRQTFPVRNRIISGLSLGVVVAEAPMESGALISAHCALEQGREVFAIPGRVTDKGSQGTNRLIKAGAKLVEDWQDVLLEISPPLKEWLARDLPAPTPSLPQLPEEEGKIFVLLKEEPLHIDELIGLSGLSAAKVSTLLLSLEMKGLAKQEAGKRFIRVL